jgi:hypothetical protein
MPGSASFCSRCGLPLDVDIDLRLGSAMGTVTGPGTGLGVAGGARPGPLAAGPEQLRSPRPGRPSAVAITVAVLAVLVAALLLVDCSGDDVPAPRPTTTTSRTASTSPTASTSTPGTTGAADAAPTSLPATTTPAGPAVTTLAVPEEIAALGLDGTLYVLRSDGELDALDLASGQSTPVLPGGVVSRMGPTALAVLESAAVYGNNEGMATVLPFDGSPIIDLGYAWVAGSSPGFAVLARRDASFSVVDGRGQELTTFGADIGARLRISAVANGRAVVQTGGHIGLIDPVDGSVEMVATGDVIAANDWGLVRVDCPALVNCQLAWGPWDDVDQATIDARALPRDAGVARLAADGSALVVRTSAGWWLLGRDGQALLQGPPEDAQQVVALGTDQAVAVHRGRSVLLRHVDGRSVNVLEVGTDEVRRPVVALSYAPLR